MVGIQPLGAEHYGKFAAFLTVIAQQKTLGSKVVEPDRFLASQAMRPVEHHIETLIEHTRVVSDLIAMMAQVLDEDTTKALTQTPTWTAYLDSRRSMEKTRSDIEQFAEVLKQLKPE